MGPDGTANRDAAQKEEAGPLAERIIPRRPETTDSETRYGGSSREGTTHNE